MCKHIVLLLLALASISVASAQYFVNPCFGRPNGRARDIVSCANYFECTNGKAYPRVCPGGQLFDGEREQCLPQTQAQCFQCPINEFRLISVPRACPQYYQCFLGSISLNACPNGLVFDGRKTVRNCNTQPSTGGCYRENEQSGDPIWPRCPQVTDRPIFIQDRYSCSV